MFLNELTHGIDLGLAHHPELGAVTVHHCEDFICCDLRGLE